MKENYALMTCPYVKPVVGGRDCSIDIPFNQMIPNMPIKSFLLLACKVLWCVLAMVVSFKIPVLRKLFAIK